MPMPKHEQTRTAGIGAAGPRGVRRGGRSPRRRRCLRRRRPTSQSREPRPARARRRGGRRRCRRAIAARRSRPRARSSSTMVSTSPKRAAARAVGVFERRRPGEFEAMAADDPGAGPVVGRGFRIVVPGDGEAVPAGGEGGDGHHVGLRFRLAGDRIGRRRDQGVDAGAGGEAIGPVQRHEDAAFRLAVGDERAHHDLGAVGDDAHEARGGDAEAGGVGGCDLGEGFGDVGGERWGRRRCASSCATGRGCGRC